MKITIILLLLVNVLYSFNLTEEEKEYLLNKKTLKLHTEMDWEPYNFTENNKEMGFVNDYMKLLEKQLPVKFEFIKNKTWNEHLDALENNEIDIVSNMIKSKEREKRFNFNKNSIFTIKTAILSKKNYSNFKELKNKTVGTMEGYYINSVLKDKYPNIKVVRYTSIYKLIEAMINDKVDAITEDYSVLTYIAEKILLDENFSINALLDTELINKVFIATNKQNNILSSILDKAIQGVHPKEKEKLFHKWHMLHEHKYIPKNITKLSYKEKKFLEKQNTFSVCSKYNYYPISLETNKKLLGISADILNKISSSNNIKFDILSISSQKDFQDKIKTNQCDLVTFIKKDLHNFDNMYSTQTIYKNSFKILSSIKSVFVKNIEDMKTDIFFIRDKNYYLALKKQHPKLNLILESNLSKIMSNIEENTKAHFIENSLTVEYIIKDYGFDKFKINGSIPNIIVKATIGVNNNFDPILTEILNKSLNKIGKETINSIIKKYEIKEYEIKNSYNKELLFIIAILVLLGILHTFKSYIIKNEKIKFESLLYNATDGVHILDKNGKLVMCSDSFAKFLGYSKEEALTLSKKDWEINAVSLSEEQINNIIKKNEFIETIYRKKDGTNIDVQVYVKFIYLNKTKYLYASLRDITKEKKAQEKLEKSHKNLEKFVDTQDNIVFLIHKKTITFANKQFLEFVNCKSLEQFKEIHKCISEYFIENDRFFHLGKVPKNKSWIETLKDIPDNKRVISMVGKDFNPKAFSITVNDFDEDTLIVSFTDISHTVIDSIVLENKVIHDKLTNAYNREFFDQNYQNIINKYNKDNSKFALALLDIDHFKIVNDTFGHDVGDDVLIKFVKTIHKYSRKDDILIRWGGEEFILLLKVDSKDDLENALEHLRASIQKQRFEKVGEKTCSIGATIYNENEEIENTIKRADENVYKAKNAGRNKVVIS